MSSPSVGGERGIAEADRRDFRPTTELTNVDPPDHLSTTMSASDSDDDMPP